MDEVESIKELWQDNSCTYTHQIPFHRYNYQYNRSFNLCWISRFGKGESAETKTFTSRGRLINEKNDKKNEPSCVGNPQAW